MVRLFCKPIAILYCTCLWPTVEASSRIIPLCRNCDATQPSRFSCSPLSSLTLGRGCVLMRWLSKTDGSKHNEYTGSSNPKQRVPLGPLESYNPSTIIAWQFLPRICPYTPSPGEYSIEECVFLVPPTMHTQ